MSRNNGYKNHLDEEDDGEELQLTDQDEAASDDHGRELAAVYIKTARSIRGRNKWDEKHRRMWLRMAIKALAEGRERQKAAEAAEQARVVAEQARLAAEQKAERERIAQEAKEQRRREHFERSMREFDERMEWLNEQTRRENAEWEAGREAREAAAATPVQVTTARPNVGREAPRAPTTIATANAGTARPATKPVTTTMLPKPGSPTGVTVPGPTQPTGSPAGSRADHGNSGFRETQPSAHVSQPPSAAWTAPKPPRVEPDRRVAPLPPPQRPPQRNVPIEPTAPKRPAASQPAPPTPRPPVASNPAPQPFTAIAKPALTGADLAAWRAARRLTQRPAAELLGVAPSTVAKAELLPGKALGEQLQVALAAALKR